jgi:ribosomal-protein-alanine N-acetyltransferase
MHPDDIAAVVAIEELSLSTSRSHSVYARELSANSYAYYLVLTAGPDIIGYAGYWLVGEEAQINIIAVHPDWRQRRLGKLLLLLLLQQARQQGVSLTTLEVRQSNQVAQQLYTSLGFETVGRRRNYYRAPAEDALLMDLEMTRPERLAALKQQLETLLHTLAGEG